MRRKTVAALLIGASLVLAAGCGGDDDDADSDSPFCKLPESGAPFDPTTPEGAQQSADALTQALTDAPEEVRADLEQARDIFAEFAQAQTDEQRAALEDKESDLATALSGVNDFGADNC